MSSWYDQQARRGEYRLRNEQNSARSFVAEYQKLGWRQTVGRRITPFYDIPTEQPEGSVRTVLVIHVEYPDTDEHTKVHMDGDQAIPEQHQNGEFKPDERIIYVVRGGKWVVQE